MLNLFKRISKRIEIASAHGLSGVTVEEIHNAVDSQEELFLAQIKNILKEAENSKISLESREVRKVDLLTSLGFDSSELVTKAKDTVEHNKLVEAEEAQANDSAQLFQRYKAKYPMDKVIPFKLFKTVLDKYKLIFAPASAYIKDVPEKNLLDIKNSIPTEDGDYFPARRAIKKIEVRYSSAVNKSKAEEYNKAIVKYIKDNGIVAGGKYSYEYDYNFQYFDKAGNRIWEDMNMHNILKNDLAYDYLQKTVPTNRKGEYLLRENTSRIDPYSQSILERSDVVSFNVKRVIASTHFELSYTFKKNLLTKLDKEVCDDRIMDIELITSDMRNNCLLIAAPKSHFNLENLATKDGYEHFHAENLTISHSIEVKDPIAFHLLAGSDQYPEGFVRIITKWGTDDDQSYLDPLVQNENNN